ncbi:hypothetical protein PYCC9005_000730 [Savitreella phatthalungensis]
MAHPQGDIITIAADRGGTFTDLIGIRGKEHKVIKLLSEDPDNYDDAPLEGIRRLLSHFRGYDIPRGQQLDLSDVRTIRMGTTVATNALLERKGERIALVVTRGFKDCLRIGNQSRPDIFALDIQRPEVLYEHVLEIDERVTLEDYAEDPGRTRTPPDLAADGCLVEGVSSETIRILQHPDPEKIRRQLESIYDLGIRSLAVCLVHGYTFQAHEKLVGELARAVGFTHVSLSHELMPMIKFVPRATSTCADAYLTPTIKNYIRSFQAGFLHGIGSESVKQDGAVAGTRCEFMQSDGGLVDVADFSGLRAILSGPAGGVVGYALTSYDSGSNVPVIGLDMGGTSCDLSRYGEGRYEHVFETTTAGVTIQSPQLDINTVAAGGGSRLFWRNGLFAVGPESAGAHPGPACYRKGGPLSITDANLFLGRLLPDFFPKIFGQNEDQGLDLEASRTEFEKLARTINDDTAEDMAADEVAWGFIKVANEAMTRPIRALTEAKGHDPTTHRLATFGGAGGQHAVAIARGLGIREILIHRYSSILSAYGIALADVVKEMQVPESKVWSASASADLERTLSGLAAETRAHLREQGFADERIVCEEYLNMRYRGTDTAIMVPRSSQRSFADEFVEQHRQEYGFTLDERDILVDDVRIRGIGKSSGEPEATVERQLRDLERRPVSEQKQHSMANVYFEGGRMLTPVFELENLKPGESLRGPAICVDGTQTVVIEPGWEAVALSTHLYVEFLPDVSALKESSLSLLKVNPVMLSVFGNRFMAIAEQMGRALQKTSVSTNVKERLDYSCALFDAEGGLVSNAPHLPVHLGSMSSCVRAQLNFWQGKLSEGDVIVSNHPSYGGTHLPDITVVTPAFHKGSIIFYVASRAHHADIGGILPGSMPPHSRELFQEGATITSEKLVSKGRFDEQRITRLLSEEPAKYPGCVGTRCLTDNISDLKAQLAANQKGIRLISALMNEYGQDAVQFYMRSIQENAEACVRAMLKEVCARSEGRRLEATDYMDDGSPIKLSISIDPDKGEAVFDFAGTGPEVYGNTNAPEAVTFSAIIYCLRCLVNQDIPLNQGCLKPIEVRIPPGSFLSPSATAAVVGGNVLTSQRVTDVVLRCFDACAASQGDCNNLTFGIEKSGDLPHGFGYYETIAGGSGAGPTWNGESGVHTHMTNTRITDVEVFEKRYPVVLHEFSLRQGSGGEGQHHGGMGVVRDIEFRIPVQASILSERRVYSPYGLHGGSDGQCGQNIWIRRHSDGRPGRRINMGGKNTGQFGVGDHIIVSTPGGGGWGKPHDPPQIKKRKAHDEGYRKGSLQARQELASSSA